MKNFLRILMLVIIVAVLVGVGIFLTKDGSSNVDVSGDVLSGEVSGEQTVTSGEEVVSGDVVVEDTASGEVVEAE